MRRKCLQYEPSGRLRGVLTTEDTEAGTEDTEEIPTRECCVSWRNEEGHSVYFLRDLRVVRGCRSVYVGAAPRHRVQSRLLDDRIRLLCAPSRLRVFAIHPSSCVGPHAEPDSPRC